MEPRHLACRAGLFAYILCILVIGTPTLSAQNVGTPAKVMRSAPPTTAHDLHGTARGVRVPAPHESGVGFGAVRPRVVLTRAPYLRVTGSLPLRFQEARDWPRSQSPAVTVDELASAVPEVVEHSSDPAISVVPSRPAPGDETVRTVVPSASATEDVAVDTSSTPPPARSEPEPTLLTADMVLGFLGNLPPPEARVSVRFEPAIPERTTAADAGAFSP